MSNNKIKYMAFDPSIDIVDQLRSKEILIVSSHRRNGIIIYKKFYAEFAGPGALIGGDFDKDAQNVILVGNHCQIEPPESINDIERGYLTRRQWVRLLKQITQESNSFYRANLIMTHFQHYFNPQTLAQIPDEALASLIGVLPETIRKVRSNRY